MSPLAVVAIVEAVALILAVGALLLSLRPQRSWDEDVEQAITVANGRSRPPRRPPR